MAKKKKTTLAARMDRDTAVRNGVYVGAAAGALTLAGVMSGRAGMTGGEKVAIGIGGTLINVALFGAIAYGATKVFAGNGR